MNANLRSILRASTLATASLALTLLATPAFAGSGDTAQIDVAYHCTSVDVSSTKDISNVLLAFTDGSTQRFEGISGHDLSFAGTGEHEGAVIETTWVKSGNNTSEDGHGTGERFDFSTEECEAEQESTPAVDEENEGDETIVTSEFTGDDAAGSTDEDDSTDEDHGDDTGNDNDNDDDTTEETDEDDESSEVDGSQASQDVTAAGDTTGAIDGETTDEEGDNEAGTAPTTTSTGTGSTITADTGAIDATMPGEGGGFDPTTIILGAAVDAPQTDAASGALVAAGEITPTTLPNAGSPAQLLALAMLLTLALGAGTLKASTKIDG